MGIRIQWPVSATNANLVVSSRGVTVMMTGGIMWRFALLPIEEVFMRRLALAVLMLLALAGCASAPLSADQKSAIKRVSIADVKMPAKPTIFGEGAATAFLLGGPLGLALNNAGSDLPTLYSKQLQKNNIDVAALFKEDLAQQLKQRGFDVVPYGQPADATVVAEVFQYGLTGDIFSSPPVRFPQLTVRVDLNKSGSNDQIWRGTASLNVLPDVYKQLEARRIDDYLQDGDLLRQQVQKASRLIAGVAMSNL